MQQRSAHENPVIFYSMAIGFLGKSTIPIPPPICFGSICPRLLVVMSTLGCYEDLWRMIGLRLISYRPNNGSDRTTN
jgi:hypothetical protein